MALESQPLTRLRSQQAALLKKKAAWTAVKSQIDNVSQKMASLSKAALFAAKTAKVSDPSVLSASSTGSTVLSTYQVEVAKLASAQVVQSSTHPSITDPFDPPMTGTITLNGKEIAIVASDTLESVTAKINAAADVGASASILQTAPGLYRMIISSEEAGIAGEMEFGGDISIWQGLGVLDGGGAANGVRAASDASFTVNGVQFTRDSNSIGDAIPGLAFNLLEAGEGAKSSITVGYDDDSLVAGVKAFVAEYNSLVDTVSKYNNWDPDTKVAGSLFGDPLVTGLLSQLRAAVFDTVAGAPSAYSSLSMVGITTGSGTAYSKDGRLTLDETKLRDAVSADRAGVAILFGAEASNAALKTNGATVTAASTLDPGFYPADSVVDGVVSSALWGAGGGWSDGTPGDFTDDRLEILFNGTRTIDKLTVHTLDSSAFPAASFGIKDFNLEYWDGSAWAALGDAVVNNTSALKTVSFAAVTTDKVRLNVTASNDGLHSRVTEVQVFEENTGVFTRLSEIASRYTASDGFVTNRTAALDAEDREIQRRMDDMQKRLETEEASLRRQYTALEVTLQKLNSQSAWLTQQLSYFKTESE